MNKSIQAYLQKSFEAPPPERKRAFLRRIHANDLRQLSIQEILTGQIAYIRKPAWVLAALLLAAGMYLLSRLQEDANPIGALTPFLALIALLECVRSSCFHMSELERATRLSLRTVLFARMFLIGVTDILILLIFAVTGSHAAHHSFFLQSAYLLTPFLLTILLGLLLERTPFGRETPYGFVAVAGLVSLSYYVGVRGEWRWFRPQYGTWWEMSTLFLLITVVVITKRRMVTLEDMAWN